MKNFTQRSLFILVLSLLSIGGIAQPEYYNATYSSGGNSIPLSWSSNGARGEQLYPVGTFGSVPSGKFISKIYWVCGSGGTGSAIYDHLKITMKQANVTALNSGSWTTGMTTVFESSSYTIDNTIGQWFAIELETPFQYDPTLPLIVGVESHMSTFYAWYCSVTTTTSGSWRSYATPYTASAPSGNGAYQKTWGFDLTDGANLPYCQNFEDGDGGFISGGILNSWEYGEPDNTVIDEANSGDNAWVTNLDGDYNNDELSYVRSLRFNMTQLVDPVIKFWTIRDLESGDDGVACQVSGDSGNSWATLGTSTSTAPWYNSSSINALSSAFSNGNGWTGETSSWGPMQHSLSSYQSDTAVFVRWMMAADGNTSAEGFGLDDIIIAESNDVSLVEMWHPDSACGTSGSVVSVSLCNRSIEPKYGFGIEVDTNGTSFTYSYTDTLDICGCDTVDVLTINSSAGGNWDIELVMDNSGDVNPANDTLTSEMVMWGTPGVSMVGGGNNCEGEVDTLVFTFTGTPSFNLSFSDGTNPTYIANITSNPFNAIVSASGTYFPVFVSDSSGCPADTSGITGLATVNFFPAPIIDLGPDSSVCEGYTLDAGAGYSAYQWSTGESSQIVTASQTNVFSVTVTDSIGCTSTDVADLNVFPAPVITIGDTVICEGSSFLFNAGGGAASYVWHDGSVGQLFAIDSIGTVTVTVTSFFGCEAAETASITAVVPNPTPSISSSSSFAPVTMDAGAGYAAYFWNTNETTQTISVAVAGTYTCTVTDGNGCQGEGDKKAKIWANGIEDLASMNGVAVYPNPAVDQLNVEIALNAFGGSVDLSLLDAEGKLVWSEMNVSKSSVQVDVSTLPAGEYILTGAGDATTKSTLVSIVK
ncbi:MAG: T9SS type A sorting domain-containing protein [Flavobacteriales bacterium]|nr:T9SS type A sorting domain-containing protein [Flavobacteriales bacterium]